MTGPEMFKARYLVSAVRYDGNNLTTIWNWVEFHGGPGATCYPVGWWVVRLKTTHESMFLTVPDDVFRDMFVEVVE